MSDADEEAGTEHTDNLSALAKDAAHPFDQTNGIVEGLEGDADDPEQVEERLDDEGATRLPFVAPIGRGAGLPSARRGDADSDAAEDADYPEEP